MDNFVVINTFDIDSMEDPSEINNLAGDGETLYFVIIEEDHETSDGGLASSNTTSAMNELVYSNDTSLTQMDIDVLISSIVDDKDVSESNSENPNSSTIPSDKQKESTGDDNVVQNDIIDISYDSDDNTEQLESCVDVPVVNLTAIRFIKNKKRRFPTYYRKEIFNELIKFLSNKKENDVVDPFTKNTRGYQLHIKDLMNVLTPNTWLKDTIIQNYMSLLVKNCNSTLVMDTDFLISYKLRGYDTTIKWFQNTDFKQIDRIVIPINPGSVHWALLVVYIWELKMYFFDSYEITSIEDDLKLATEFCCNIINHNIENPAVDKISPMDWSFFNGNSPLQLNNDDCGVFTCMNARCFLSRKPLAYCQKDIPILRQIIAWELINNTLEPM